MLQIPMLPAWEGTRDADADALSVLTSASAPDAAMRLSSVCFLFPALIPTWLLSQLCAVPPLCEWLSGCVELRGRAGPQPPPGLNILNILYI